MDKIGLSFEFGMLRVSKVLRGSFSAVSTPISTTWCSFCISVRGLQVLHTCAPHKAENIRNFRRKCFQICPPFSGLFRLLFLKRLKKWCWNFRKFPLNFMFFSPIFMKMCRNLRKILRTWFGEMNAENIKTNSPDLRNSQRTSKLAANCRIVAHSLGSEPAGKNEDLLL